MGLNLVVVQGKLGRDPELRATPSGVSVCKFSMAVSEKFKDKNGQKKETTYWANVVAWKGLAEICSKYLVKGQECIITGKLQENKWEKDGVKHTTTEIIATGMNFSGPAPAAKDDSDFPPPF